MKSWWMLVTVTIAGLGAVMACSASGNGDETHFSRACSDCSPDFRICATGHCDGGTADARPSSSTPLLGAAGSPGAAVSSGTGAGPGMDRSGSAAGSRGSGGSVSTDGSAGGSPSAGGSMSAGGGEASGGAPAPASGGMSSQQTAPSSCNDGTKNGFESDVDCGGTCPPCGSGHACTIARDCTSLVCVGAICQVASCYDQAKNGNETGVDCGGSCSPCAFVKACMGPADCASRVCKDGRCLPPTCDGGVSTDGGVCR